MANRAATPSPSTPVSAVSLANIKGRRRAPKTSELIALNLAAHIVDAELPEGAILPTEREMTETLGVGRTTLREALRLLETRGVLTIRPGPGGGPVVRYPKAEDLGAALTLILQFAGSSLADVSEAREALEPTLAALAAGRANVKMIRPLRESVARMLETEDDADRFIAENALFHSLVAEASGSVVLRVFVESLKSISDGTAVGVQYSPKRRHAVAEAHTRIVDAIEARDVDAAEEAMRRHLEEARRYWERKYGDLVSQPVRWLQ